MLVLTKEQYDELPDFAKPGFELVGDQYIPVKDASLKKLADNLNKERDSYKSELEDYKSKEDERIKTAAEEARKAALDEAMKSGGKEVEELISQRVTEAVEGTTKEWEGKFNAQSENLNALRANAKSGLLDSIVAKAGVTEKGSEAMKMLLANFVDVAEDGSEVLKMPDGSDCEYKRDEYVENVIKKHELFSALIKPAVVVSQTGGEGYKPGKQEGLSVAASNYLNMATRT